jgi:hypothetical protein
VLVSIPHGSLAAVHGRPAVGHDTSSASGSYDATVVIGELPHDLGVQWIAETALDAALSCTEPTVNDLVACGDEHPN